MTLRRRQNDGREKHSAEDDFSTEIDSHLQLEADRIADERGVSPADAMDAARREFGNVTAHRERHYESRRWMPLEHIVRDARLALRRLLHERRFSAMAILTIAICLGGNLAIFAAVDAILLRPLPFPRPDRLVTIYNTYPAAGVMDDGASVANYYERRSQLSTLPLVALFQYTTAIVGDTGATDREDVTVVTPEFFATLGVTPALGRFFTEADIADNAPPLVVLTDAAWHEHFNADPSVVGRTLRINGAPIQVIGVLPTTFRFLSSTAMLYAAYQSRPDQRVTRNRHSGSNSQMIARLADGAGLEAAQAEIDAQNAALETQDPQAAMIAAAGFRSVVVSLHGRHVEAARPMLWLLQAGALMLLAIGAVNLVNLLLVRAAGRSKEVAVRTAIGASRWDLIRSVAVETVILTTAGGIAGLGLGALGMQALAAFGADQLPLGSTIALGWRPLVVAMAAAILVGLLMSIPVAWLSAIQPRVMTRGWIADGLRAQGRAGTASRSVQRLRHAFVISEIALAFILLTSAGLLAESLQRVMSVPTGFDAGHTITGHVTLPYPAYGGAERIRFVERLTEQLRQLPGVTVAAVASNVPLSGNDLKSSANVPGFQLAPGDSPHAVYSYWVSRDYFRALGLQVNEGRVFSVDDDARGDRVAVIDDDFARRYFAGGSAIRQQLYAGSSPGPVDQAFTIVGVVAPVRQSALDDTTAQGTVYYPYRYRTDNGLFVIVRASGAIAPLGSSMARIVREIDPDLPLNKVETMDARVSESLMGHRSPALLVTIFAIVALLLASIGTHGVLSYAVSERRREIGLRLALGAQPSQIRAQFLAVGARLLAVGLALGILGALASGRLLQASLYNTATINMPILAAAAGVMALLLAVACLLPAGRAARLSPMIAMAEE